MKEREKERGGGGKIDLIPTRTYDRSVVSWYRAISANIIYDFLKEKRIAGGTCSSSILFSSFNDKISD